MASSACIAELNRELATQVAANLRHRDLIEVLACVPWAIPDDEGLAWWLESVLAGGESWAALASDSVPVAMGGLRHLPERPDLALSWCVGTDRKLEAGATIYLHALKIHDEWRRRGVRRIQCSCLDTPEESSEWLERLGYVREGVMRSAGRNGENFVLWGRVYGD